MYDLGPYKGILFTKIKGSLVAIGTGGAGGGGGGGGGGGKRPAVSWVQHMKGKAHPSLFIVKVKYFPQMCKPYRKNVKILNIGTYMSEQTV